MHKYYQNKQLVFKTRWMTTEGLYFSEKELDEDTILPVLSGQEAMGSDIIFLPFNQIKKMIPLYENQPPLLDIDVIDERKYKSLVADFENKHQLEEAIHEIEANSSLKEQTEVLRNKTWIRNLFYTIAIAFFGFSLVIMAREIEQGHTIDLNGSKAGFKNILFSIAEKLGFLGSIVLTAVLVLGFAYFTYTIYKSNNTERQIWKK
ncbi:hypothetical protein LZQ00_09385 [Sphingobacterium sp. SRCM116780]|uniref:hypothetical protein n=1 Tax=Sphingobacterium sp. SRCM116780 TaxID=2907623 RepID=UPI001F35799F|nr:hypothetical protein [Sphingobacterium sp. SRCM116780]UIR54483.1 hypothetical protein LZQ00_09385 [Sphingobacterium sp. SRCM116780]